MIFNSWFFTVFLYTCSDSWRESCFQMQIEIIWEASIACCFHLLIKLGWDKARVAFAQYLLRAKKSLPVLDSRTERAALFHNHRLFSGSQGRAEYIFFLDHLSAPPSSLSISLGAFPGSPFTASLLQERSSLHFPGETVSWEMRMKIKLGVWDGLFNPFFLHRFFFFSYLNNNNKRNKYWRWKYWWYNLCLPGWIFKKLNPFGSDTLALSS